MSSKKYLTKTCQDLERALRSSEPLSDAARSKAAAMISRLEMTIRQPSCLDCGDYKGCLYAPKDPTRVRINCILHREAEMTEWAYPDEEPPPVGVTVLGEFDSPAGPYLTECQYLPNGLWRQKSIAAWSAAEPLRWRYQGKK